MAHESGARKMEKRYGVNRHSDANWNFGMEMTLREYENSLFQIEKLDATVKDLRLEINHLQAAKNRADTQVKELFISKMSTRSRIKNHIKQFRKWGATTYVSYQACYK